MTSREFEMSLLALTAWRAAKSDNIDEILAIACVIRNHVHTYGKTYTAVCEGFVVNRSWPDIRHPLLINPNAGVLSAMEGIYKNETPDLTSNHLHKNGAMYFCRVVDHQGTGDWIETEVLLKPEQHILIGSFGVQQFYE